MFLVFLKFRIFKMYQVSRLRVTITETWYFVYLHAYEVSHRCDMALTAIMNKIDWHSSVNLNTLQMSNNLQTPGQPTGYR